MIAATLNRKATHIENKRLITITNLATKAALNIKAAEIESKIPGLTNLATKAAFNTKAIETENEIPDTTGFITTPEFNKSTK